MQPIIGFTVEELEAGLTVMEDSMRMGEFAKVQLCTASLPTADELELVSINMALAGFHAKNFEAKMVEGIPTTSFVLRKGSPAWPLLIPIIVPVLTIGLIAFGIFRIETITKALLPIVLVIGGVVIVTVALQSRRGERAPVRVIESRPGVPEGAYVASTIPNSEGKGSTNSNPADQLEMLPQTELRDEVKKLWRQACEWEGIDPEAKFVVFSDENPYNQAYSEAMKKLLRFKQVQEGEWQPDVSAEERLVGRPFDKYQAATGGKFFIRQVNPNQIKVTRSDIKGSFFVDFGPLAVLPEGPEPTYPLTAEQACIGILGLTKEEAKRVTSGIPEEVEDSDPRAEKLWDLWDELEAESSPMTISTVENPKPDTTLTVRCMYCKKYMGERPGEGTTGETSSICKECWEIHMPGEPYPEDISKPSVFDRIKRRLGIRVYKWQLIFPDSNEIVEREKAFGDEKKALYNALDYLEHGINNKYRDRWDPVKLTIWDSQTNEKITMIGTLDLDQYLTVGYLLGPRLGYEVYQVKTENETELPREWIFPGEKPEPILEVTPGMLPQTKGAGEEKGWKDFYTGNKVQASIDAYNWRIEAKNISEEEQKKLHESLKTPFQDLVEYQNLQSWGFASNLITLEEAQQLFQLYGGDAPSPEKWDELTLAEKIAGTLFAQELTEQKIKRARSSMPKTEEREKKTLWDRAMFLLQKKFVRVMASDDEIDEIMTACAECPMPVQDQMRSDLVLYPLFDAIAMWVQPVENALSAYEPKVHQIAKFMIERYEREYSIKSEGKKTSAGGPFVNVGERIRFIGQSKTRRGDWPEDKWLEYGVTGAVSEFHPESPAVTAGGKYFEALPPYAVVRWDFGGETVIDPEDEGARWERVSGASESKTPTEYVAVILAMAEWYAKNLRPMTLEEMSPIADKYFRSVKEIDAFYDYLNTPEGTKRFKEELDEALRRHGKVIPPGEEHSALTEILKLSPDSPEGKRLLDPNLFPDRTEALNKLGEYTVLEVHDDGDLTVQSYGKTYVVTTEGEIFVSYTPEEALKKILGDTEAKTVKMSKIYGAWVWKVPPSTSDAVLDALTAIEEFPPPTPEGWRLLQMEAGTFKSLEEARYIVPTSPGKYVLAIGLGDTMDAEIIVVNEGFQPATTKPSREDVEVYVSLPPYKASIWVVNVKTNRELWRLDGAENIGRFGSKYRNRDELEEGVLKYLEDIGVLSAPPQPAVIPTKPAAEEPGEGEREYIADSPEYLTSTIDMTGMRQKLDQAFQEAVERVKNGG